MIFLYVTRNTPGLCWWSVSGVQCLTTGYSGLQCWPTGPAGRLRLPGLPGLLGMASRGAY